MSNLPGIVILGVQKCGTSTLHNSLVSHPSINPPIHPVLKTPIKEIDFFFDRWNQGVDWYRSHFVGPNGIFIDSSPNYISEPSCYEKIHQVLPDAKIIICVRHPVRRAYSQYNYYRNLMPKSGHWDWRPDLDFVSNIQMEMKNGLTRFRGILSKGIYIDQIHELLKYFESRSIYISVMDQWTADFEGELDSILSFLQLERKPLTLDVQNKQIYKIDPLDKRTYHMLLDYYKPFNERLFEFLGREIKEWSC